MVWTINECPFKYWTASKDKDNRVMIIASLPILTKHERWPPAERFSRSRAWVRRQSSVLCVSPPRPDVITRHRGPLAVSPTPTHSCIWVNPPPLQHSWDDSARQNILTCLSSIWLLSEIKSILQHWRLFSCSNRGSFLNPENWFNSTHFLLILLNGD